MRKLYEKRELMFALLWIVAYCVVLAPIKGQFGYGSVWWLIAMSAFSAGIIWFIKTNDLEEKYGLKGFLQNSGRYLFFIPMWIIATGNLWDGIAPSYSGISLVIATASMILVGFVEEMIFRGFLFVAMLKNGKTTQAILISALTFGIGHIVNLFTGQAGFDTVMQVIFAISWGFIFTMVFYRSGCLIPCIIAHAMIDVSSLYGADNDLSDRIYIGVTILVAIVYCIYLGRLKGAGSEEKLPGQTSVRYTQKV